MMRSGEIMQAWSTFYATIGAASATLLGLLFVAVSVNAKAALGSDDRLTSAMTAQAFQNYLAVLLVALLALFPDVPPKVFGYLTLFAGVSRAVYVGVRFVQMLRHRAPRRSLIFALRRHASSVIGFGLLIVAAAYMAVGRGEEHNMLAAATVVLLFSATTVSWELLRRIANPQVE
jgi:hypothetical protein